MEPSSEVEEKYYRVTLECGHTLKVSEEDSIRYIEGEVHVYCQPCRDMYFDYKTVKKVEEIA